MEKAATSSLTNEVLGHISVSPLFSSKLFITGSRTRAGLKVKICINSREVKL